jgi:hypothetical protein
VPHLDQRVRRFVVKDLLEPLRRSANVAQVQEEQPLPGGEMPP